MNLKQILPIEMNYTLRHFCELQKKETPEAAKETLGADKRVFFLDAPAYGNIGDQAIAYAMEMFVKDVLPDYRQIEVTEDKLPATLRWLKDNIREADLICLTGGGNMGVMYQRYESARRLILKNFPHNPIVIFPQTFDYGDKGYDARELERAKNIYGNVKKLVLCARDEESFGKMKQCFPNAKVLFCPDIVLSLDYRGRFVRNEEVGICLRNDAEAVLNDAEREKVYAQFPGYVSLSTTDTDTMMINYRNRKQTVEKKLEEFGSKKIVITDRLHGTIFSFITGVPVIALPNTNGKVERVCRYLSPNGNVIFTKKSCDFFIPEEKLQGSVKEDFREVSDAIRYIVAD